MNRTVLFVNHKKSQCGVYEFGKNVGAVLLRSKKYNFIYTECSSLNELKADIVKNNPNVIIYNYTSSTMPWAADKIYRGIYKSNIININIPQIGIIHETTQDVSDRATAYRSKFLFGKGINLSNSLFDFYIAPDPTLLLKNNLVYKTGRLIPPYKNNFEAPEVPTIGSFGFGTPKKGFEKIVQLVQREFNEAIIRFNIPFADFGDKDGVGAKEIAKRCNALVNKSGIKLYISHDFLDHGEILDFLAKNTINVFLYEDANGRGLSSVIDSALAVQRPIAISESSMFRHITDASPSICVTKNNLKTIIENGITPLLKYYSEWTPDNLLWDYERILDSIFYKQNNLENHKKNIASILYFELNKLLLRPIKSFTWLRSSKDEVVDDMQVVNSASYNPVRISVGDSLNRILDNDARNLYKPAINKITELVPKTISKKIPEANVQQAFVFDTAWRYISLYKNPKILCIGSYEDTASMSLIKMGLKVEEIDPVLNYSLQEYVTKPSTTKESYDIIFSTSVIEHDRDDESFIKCVSDLLAPGGVFIMTCDYKDGWVPGDLKPDVDFRFYTKNDLKNRLLPLMKNCELVDKPQWDCSNPDFYYLNKYRYTFATFVVEKHIKNN